MLLSIIGSSPATFREGKWNARFLFFHQSYFFSKGSFWLYLWLQCIRLYWLSIDYFSYSSNWFGFLENLFCVRILPTSSHLPRCCCCFIKYERISRPCIKPRLNRLVDTLRYKVGHDIFVFSVLISPFFSD